MAGVREAEDPCRVRSEVKVYGGRPSQVAGDAAEVVVSDKRSSDAAVECTLFCEARVRDIDAFGGQGAGGEAILDMARAGCWEAIFQRSQVRATSMRYR